jgi:P-aminobenzoate N-oxygenase AurF
MTPSSGNTAAIPAGDTATFERPNRTNEERIERLSAISLKRVIEPEDAVAGSVGEGQLIPDELLSVAGLGLDLTAEQRLLLSREEVASIADTGVRFESILMAGFAFDILRRNLTDPRVTYILHEIGEETRHSRLFVKMISEIRPAAKNPFDGAIARALQRVVVPLLASMPATFCVAVLTGEEIPDLFQKLASENPATDPFIRNVNRYHRQEEARHLAFARMILPELWRRSSPVDRFLVRTVSPFLAQGMFETIVHPGVYRVIGLPPWRTWRAVNRTKERLELKHMALRAILGSVRDAGAFGRGAVPAAWRRVCAVDRSGKPA